MSERCLREKGLQAAGSCFPVSSPEHTHYCCSSGKRDAGCFQEPVLCTLAPWGSQASLLEPTCPEAEGRGSGPPPSPVSSQESSPQAQLHSPKWPKDASHPLVLGKDKSELSSLKKEETEEVPSLRQEVECEDISRSEEASATQHHVHLPSAEG